MHSLTYPEISHEYYQPNEPIHILRKKETHVYNKIKKLVRKNKLDLY